MSASGTISLSLRSALLELYFRQRAAAQTQLYVALTRTVATANSVGDQLDEPISNGYARAPYSTGADLWTPSGYGEVFNARQIDFPEATGSWGLVVGWALVTSLTAGDTLAVGRLVSQGPVELGVRPFVAAGGLTVGLYD